MPALARPVSDIVVANWTPLPAFQQLDETIPDDGLTEVTASVPVLDGGRDLVVGLTPLPTPISRDGHRMLVRCVLDDVGQTGTLVVKLRQAGSDIATRTLAPPASYGTVILALTEAEAAQITDYALLEASLSFSITLEPVATAHVSWIELEIPTAPAGLPIAAVQPRLAVRRW